MSRAQQAQWVSDERSNKEQEVVPLLYCCKCSLIYLPASGRLEHRRMFWRSARVTRGTASGYYILSCACLRAMQRRDPSQRSGSLLFGSYAEAAARWNGYQLRLMSEASAIRERMHPDFLAAQNALLPLEDQLTLRAAPAPLEETGEQAVAPDDGAQGALDLSGSA